MEELEKKDVIAKSLLELEYYPVVKNENVDLHQSLKIPFASMAAFGASLASLSSSFRTITQTINSSTQGLYRMIIPGSATGTLVEKNGITLGNMVGADGHTFSGRARFIQVGNNPISVATTMPFNPTVLFMASALMSIEKKLDSIQETQQEIFEFIKEDKKSKLQGNIEFLQDVLEKYKFNWDNETYISSMYTKVQDIQQESIQNVSFYRTQIQRILLQKGIVVSRQDVKKQLQKIQMEFHNYQLAVYTYGFSSFLGVLLLKNFDRKYLNSIVGKIEEISYQYRELYTKCYNQIEKAADTSLQKRFLDGLASISGAAGEKIAKIPVISKSQLDETLIQSKENLNLHNQKETKQIVEQFISNHDDGVKLFIENIKELDRLYNEPVQLYFDKNNLYLLEK